MLFIRVFIMQFNPLKLILNWIQFFTIVRFLLTKTGRILFEHLDDEL